MTPKEVLARTEHRSWPIPDSKWKYYQEWNDAVFLHWKVDAERIRTLIGREPDTYEGQAWISLVAFDMNKVHPRGFPIWGPLSDFHELNIRTYTRKDDRSGVHFFSLEASKRLASGIAGRISSLPYRYSEIKRQANRFVCKNENGSILDVAYEPLNELTDKDDLDIWLTERYALIQHQDGRTTYFDVHHPEWPIRNVRIKKLKVDYPEFRELFAGDPDRAHYSPGVQVVSWGKQLL